MVHLVLVPRFERSRYRVLGCLPRRVEPPTLRTPETSTEDSPTVVASSWWVELSCESHCRPVSSPVVKEERIKIFDFFGFYWYLFI